MSNYETVLFLIGLCALIITATTVGIFGAIMLFGSYMHQRLCDIHTELIKLQSTPSEHTKKEPTP